MRVKLYPDEHSRTGLPDGGGRLLQWRSEAHRAAREQLDALLKTQAGALISARIESRVAAKIAKLVSGTTLSLDEIRVLQGEIGLLSDLASRPAEFLIGGPVATLEGAGGDLKVSGGMRNAG